MSNKPLTPEEKSDILKSLQKIQQMQRDINVKNSRPISDDEVRRKVNRNDYGLSLDNPVILDNIPLSAAFLNLIKSPAGTQFVQEKRGTVRNGEGHIVDIYDGYYLNKDGEKVGTRFYIDCYCSRSVTVPPSGWFGKDETIPKKVGCLIPLVVVLCAIGIASTTLAKCL